MKRKLIVTALVVTIVAIIAATAATALGGGIINNSTVCGQGAVVFLGANPKTAPVYNAACVD